ncbi:MAG TPA: hypothetical protein VE031_11325 [Chthoniobacterales bacterium]|nr:hypothetical protein [Chthoniobacterales bacterium]
MKPRLIVLLALFLLRATAPAQEIASAATVADRIGQTVEFQDEVKAVSWSRSTNGLRKLLPVIQPDPDMTAWVNLENVSLAEKFANRTGP